MWKGKVWGEAAELQKKRQGEVEEVEEVAEEVQIGVVAVALKELKRS